MLNFIHATVYHTLVMHACSHFYFISGLCANIGGCVISCDNEDTNHLERKGMGGKGKWGKDKEE